MRVYELGFIMKPDLSEQDAHGAIEAVTQSLTAGGATIDKVDDWGRRKLAYRVRGFWNGHYVFIQYSAEDSSNLTSEVERRLRVADSIIKFMTIRIDEDLKRQKKAAERRAKRAPKLAARAAARQADSLPPKAATPGTPAPEAPVPEAPAPADATPPASAATSESEGSAEKEGTPEAAADSATSAEAETPTVVSETGSQAEVAAASDAQTDESASESPASE